LCILACKSFDDVVEVLKKAKQELSDIMQACEFMDAESLDKVMRFRNSAPLFGKDSQDYPFYTMIEVANNNDPEVVPEESERLLSFMELVEEHIHDGLVPSGEK
jgi:hypothetical protein